jgi:hypothetical protein
VADAADSRQLRHIPGLGSIRVKIEKIASRIHRADGVDFCRHGSGLSSSRVTG